MRISPVASTRFGYNPVSTKPAAASQTLAGQNRQMVEELEAATLQNLAVSMPASAFSGGFMLSEGDKRNLEILSRVAELKKADALQRIASTSGLDLNF